MAHFNPQMCEPSCCVNCAGQISINADNCTLCWETSGDVIRAELWRMDEPPVLVSDQAAGCALNPTAGDYELRAFCRVGDGEITMLVDEETVGTWESCESASCCEDILAAFSQLRLTVTATGDEWSDASGTWVFNDSCGELVFQWAPSFTGGFYSGVSTITSGGYSESYDTYWKYESVTASFYPGSGVFASVVLRARYIKTFVGTPLLSGFLPGTSAINTKVSDQLGGSCLIAETQASCEVKVATSGNFLGSGGGSSGGGSSGATVTVAQPPPGCLLVEARFV
jgi:hypothetical protein